MPFKKKEKEEVETKVSKTEEVATIIRKGVFNLFDRIPNGSLRDGEVSKLAEEINKLYA